jgi:AmiR/NasT family two-component response regulator
MNTLEMENAQLRTALDSRVVIEQAKGILAERFGLDLHNAFLLLRRAARTSRRGLHAVAIAVIESPETPRELVVVMDRDGRRDG